jgi:hypothetical protein
MRNSWTILSSKSLAGLMMGDLEEVVVVGEGIARLELSASYHVPVNDCTPHACKYNSPHHTLYFFFWPI